MSSSALLSSVSSPPLSLPLSASSVSDTGWADNARQSPSPNFTARADGEQPSLLVIHNISMPPGRFATGDIEALFCNTLDFDADPFYQTIRGLRVSAHFLITRAGETVQFVSTLDRAWHAGVSSFNGRAGCNDFAIGIELEGCDDLPFDPTQYTVLAQLTTAIRARHAITAVVGHSDIAPGRKTDPGPYFDWAAFANAASLSRDLLPFASGV